MSEKPVVRFGVKTHMKRKSRFLGLALNCGWALVSIVAMRWMLPKFFGDVSSFAVQITTPFIVGVGGLFLLLVLGVVWETRRSD